MVTYGDCNTAEVDVAADTSTTLATITIPSGQGGNIKFIVVSVGPTATTAASVSGYISLTRGSQGGTFRFPVFAGNYDADLGVSQTLSEKLPVDIPVLANEVITIKGEFNGALAGCNAGIIWEA